MSGVPTGCRSVVQSSFYRMCAVLPAVYPCHNDYRIQHDATAAHTLHWQMGLPSPVGLHTPLQLPCFLADDVLQLILRGAHRLNCCLIDNDVATLCNGTNAKPAHTHTHTQGDRCKSKTKSGRPVRLLAVASSSYSRVQQGIFCGSAANRT